VPREVCIAAPVAHQLPLLESAARFKIARFGRRVGKNVAVLNALTLGHGPVDPLTGAPMHKGAAQGGHMLWVAPSYPQAGTIWERQLVPRFSGVPGVALNEQKKLIRIEGAGSILVRSAESVDNIRGMSFDGFGGDEAAYWDLQYGWNSVIMPGLTDRNGWGIFISTPKLGSYFNELCEAEQDGTLGKDWAQFHLRTRDNPKLPPDAVEALYASYPAGSTDLMQELDAELITEHGMLFSKSHFARRFTAARYQGVTCAELTGDTKEIPFLEIVIFCDLAISLKETADYTVFKVVGITAPIGGARRAFVLDVVRKRMEGPDQAAEIERLTALWHPRKVMVEAVAYQMYMVQHLRRSTVMRGVEVIPVGVDKDKRTRAVPWAAMLGRGEVFFPQHATWLADYVSEHMRFTGDGKRHDDQVDPGSMLANYLMKPASTGRTRTATF
jgi:predicted phage terminase large subunit-like protein